MPASSQASLGKTVGGRVGAQSVTIPLGVAISCGLSFYVLYEQVFEGMPTFNGTVYTWLLSDGLQLNVGFLIDHLSAMMMAVVSFVSLMVHIYTIGYMAVTMMAINASSATYPCSPSRC